MPTYGQMREVPPPGASNDAEYGTAPVVLRVGRCDSYCGVCGRSADLYEQSHAKLLGYGPENGQPGCGAVWTHVTTDYCDPDAEAQVRALRPDLTFV